NIILRLEQEVLGPEDADAALLEGKRTPIRLRRPGLEHRLPDLVIGKYRRAAQFFQGRRVNGDNLPCRWGEVFGFGWGYIHRVALGRLLPHRPVAFGQQAQTDEICNRGCRANALAADGDSLGGEGQGLSRITMPLPKIVEPATEQGTTNGEQMAG